MRIDDAAMTLSSRESGGLLRRWNHDIIVTASGDSRCNYRDSIDIDAGVFTTLVVLMTLSSCSAEAVRQILSG